MSRIIRVTCCEDCPFMTAYGEFRQCWRAKIVIKPKDMKTFPKYCPLEEEEK